jgi:adenine-specific DNA-methyltransferase
MADLEYIHQYGQYFTISTILQDALVNFIQNNPKIILEPSIGRGDLVLAVKEMFPDSKIDMYEIDENIELLEGISQSRVKYGDFLQKKLKKLYPTIVGNPPYVKTKSGNLYIDFIEKCVSSLEKNGELIFIVPSDFLKLTSSARLINSMMDSGTFTHIFHPNNEKLFENASIDVIVFRYCNNPELSKVVEYNGEMMYIINSKGVITFSKELNHNSTIIEDIFDVYVGLVSGKEDVYKNEEIGNISLLTKENYREKYILVEKIPSHNQAIDTLLIENKDRLLSRKIRKFNENNWWLWGAPRNIKVMSQNSGKPCIYIYNLSRSDKIAFVGNVEYFGGNLIMLLPKIECDLHKIVDFLNSDTFKSNFMFSGRFKIGHRQISSTHILI